MQHKRQVPQKPQNFTQRASMAKSPPSQRPSNSNFSTNSQTGTKKTTIEIKNAK